jgi:hypothetical protein
VLCDADRLEDPVSEYLLDGIALGLGLREPVDNTVLDRSAEGERELVPLLDSVGLPEPVREGEGDPVNVLPLNVPIPDPVTV